jgi:DNA-binding PadR family transcriptional regulator
MTILCDKPSGLHGYAVEKELQTLRLFQGQPPDFGGLYRLLRRMEDEGLLSSAEDDSQTGPSRRVYRLTDRGIKCLSRWVDSLAAYQEMLGDLLSRAQKTMFECPERRS